MTVILKNTTVSGIRISDLNGIGIDGSGQRDVTNKFTLWQLNKSVALNTYINNGTVLINDGTVDLPIIDALTHIKPISEYVAATNEDAVAYALVLGG